MALFDVLFAVAKTIDNWSLQEKFQKDRKSLNGEELNELQKKLSWEVDRATGIKQQELENVLNEVDSEISKRFFEDLEKGA